MQLLNLLLATAGLASAADIWRTTGSNCGGDRIGCAGIQQNVCCNFSVGRSQILWNLPANSRGQGWTNQGCSGSVGTFQNQNAVTGRCVTFSWNVFSARWLQGLSARDEAAADEEAPCEDPNAAIYTLDGVEHKVKIPEGKVAEVEQWIEKGEWKELAKLETF